MGVKIREKRGKLYLDIMYKGQRRWEALDLRVPKDAAAKRETMRLAEAIRHKRELQLTSERYQLLDPVASKQTLIDYAENVARTYDKKMHLPKSLKYLRPYAGETLLYDVNERFVDGYRAYLLEQKTIGAATAKHYIDALKALLAKAERERLIEYNPAKGMKTIRVPEQKRPFLTIEEIQKLYNTPAHGGELAEECRRAFLLSCFTGLRLSDLKSLTWGDIERAPEPMIVKRQSKTKDVVRIPLAPTAWELIDDKELHHRDELVFPRMTASNSVNVYIPLIAWRKNAGIDRAFGWHAARHSFAMMTLEASGDIYSVSRLLGHSDIRITEVYLRLLDSRKKEIIASLPELKDEQKTFEFKQPKQA
jgi:integrase